VRIPFPYAGPDKTHESGLQFVHGPSIAARHAGLALRAQRAMQNRREKNEQGNEDQKGSQEKTGSEHEGKKGCQAGQEGNQELTGTVQLTTDHEPAPAGSCFAALWISGHCAFIHNILKVFHFPKCALT
jgi:hypothetical protein